MAGILDGGGVGCSVIGDEAKRQVRLSRCARQAHTDGCSDEGIVMNSIRDGPTTMVSLMPIPLRRVSDMPATMKVELGA